MLPPRPTDYGAGPPPPPPPQPFPSEGGDPIEVCDARRIPPYGAELANHIIGSHPADGASLVRPLHSCERALQMMRRDGLVREWLLRGDAGRPSQGALDNAFAMHMDVRFASSGVGPVPAGSLVQQTSQLLVIPFATVNEMTMGSIYGASSNGDYGWDASRSNTRFVYNESTGECLTFSWHGAVVIVSWFNPRDRFTRERAVFMFLAPRTPDEEPEHLLTHMSFVETCRCFKCDQEGPLCQCIQVRTERSLTSPVDFSGFSMSDMLGDFRGHCHTLVYEAKSGVLQRSTLSGASLSSFLTKRNETLSLKRQMLDQLGLLLSSPLADMSMVAAQVPNYRALAANVIAFCYSEDEADGDVGAATGGPKPKRKRGPRSSELTDEQRAMREFTRKERNRHHARVSNEKRRVKQARTLQRREMLLGAVARMHDLMNHYRDVGRQLQEQISEGAAHPGALAGSPAVPVVGGPDGQQRRLAVSPADLRPEAYREGVNAGGYPPPPRRVHVLEHEGGGAASHPAGGPGGNADVLLLDSYPLPPPAPPSPHP